MQPYAIVLIALAAVIAVIFLFALLCDRFAFGKRHDKNPLLKYFTAEDFGLAATPVSLAHGLKGFLYVKDGVENLNKLIVFCHGLGPGHIAYMSEIAYFCNLGYTVLAVDNRGSGLSSGRNLKGIYAGAQAAIAAIGYAKGLTPAPDKIFVVGHSWGGYSALCASAKCKVDGVVAISAPDAPAKMVAVAASKNITKPLAYTVRPFLWLINFLKFGASGNTSAARSASKNNCPTLLIQGSSDLVVTRQTGVYYKAKGENVTKILEEGKYHNPYNTPAAEAKLAELLKSLQTGKKDFSDFDFSAATEEDSAVMQKISDFLKAI